MQKEHLEETYTYVSEKQILPQFHQWQWMLHLFMQRLNYFNFRFMEQQI